MKRIGNITLKYKVFDVVTFNIVKKKIVRIKKGGFN